MNGKMENLYECITWRSRLHSI